MKRSFLVVALLISCLPTLQAADFLKNFTFSEKGVLNLWKEKLHKGRVKYAVMPGEVGDHVKATSVNAASGIYYEIQYDPQKLPYMSWKWKVDKFPKKNPQEKEIITDDFAARVYVIFPANVFIFSRCLEYVWDNALEEGTITKSPLSGRIKVFVLRKGKKKGWIHEERNVFKDYLEAYGEDPEDFEDKVGAIAFMVDTDDTNSQAISYIDEVRIGYTKPLLKK